MLLANVEALAQTDNGEGAEGCVCGWSDAPIPCLWVWTGDCWGDCASFWNYCSINATYSWCGC